MSAIRTTVSAELVPRVSLDELVSAWSEYLAVDRAETTRAAYLKGLRLFREWLQAAGLDLARVRPADVRTWREHLKETYAAQTVNLWLSAVRRFYAFLVEEYNAPILNPAAEVRGASRRGQSRRHKRDELTSSEVLVVLVTCDDSDAGIRDQAILSLMAYCALRTVEVHRSDIVDLQTRDNRTVLWIRGKGHEEADDFVVLPATAEAAVQSWIAARGKESGPLFRSLSRQNRDNRLSLRAIRGMVKARFDNAGVVGDRKSTHSLRHSAISSAIRHGAEPLQVQAMARHRSFDTTLGYYHEIARTTNPAEDLVDYSNNAPTGDGKSLLATL